MEPVRAPKLAPYLAVHDAAGLAAFIEEALDGRPGYREVDGDGRIRHLELRIADSVVMLGDAPEGRRPFPAMVHLYVDDVDATYRRALRAGATSVRPPADAPDGRRGGVVDRWGNEWWFTRPAPG